jgi:UDP-N-acetylglucosamine:LPS N-acetylglucosamine transferase
MATICLVCSAGGHLYQLYSLNPFWEHEDRFWVSFPQEDAKYLLKDERKYWASYPTNRSVKNLIKNTFLAWRVLRLERPVLVVSTGAGVSVPFIIMAKLFGIRTIYLESITRNEELSLSARIVYPVVDKLLVQWEDLTLRYKKATFKGRVI